jgi:glucose/arabinose dehydrogenase
MRKRAFAVVALAVMAVLPGLVRLVLDGERVVAEEHLLTDLAQRVRDVRQGPDGAVYVLTDAGSLLRFTPKR